MDHLLKIKPSFVLYGSRISNMQNSCLDFSRLLVRNRYVPFFSMYTLAHPLQKWCTIRTVENLANSLHSAIIETHHFSYLTIWSPKPTKTSLTSSILWQPIKLNVVSAKMQYGSNIQKSKMAYRDIVFHKKKVKHSYHNKSNLTHHIHCWWVAYTAFVRYSAIQLVHCKE